MTGDGSAGLSTAEALREIRSLREDVAELRQYYGSSDDDATTMDAEAAEYVEMAENLSGVVDDPGVDTTPPSPAAQANRTSGDKSYRELAADATGAGEGDNPALRDAGTAGRNDASRDAYRNIVEAEKDAGAGTADLDDYRAIIAKLEGSEGSRSDDGA